MDRAIHKNVKIGSGPGGKPKFTELTELSLI